jgi:ABC-type branched-subunit amino acid transport system ATPase component
LETGRINIEGEGKRLLDNDSVKHAYLGRKRGIEVIKKNRE